MNKEIETLLSEQLSSWETAQNNYAALKRVRIKRCESERLPVQNTVQPGTYCFFCCQSR